MVEPTPIIATTATDADAVYISNHLAQADEEDRLAKQSTNDTKQHRERARAHRLEAGKRFIEVRTRLMNFGPDKSVSGPKKGRPTNPFRDWLRDNNYKWSTVHRYMKLAGFTQEQRDMHRAQARDQKRAERNITAAVTPKAFRIGWINLLVERFGLTHGSLRDHRAKIAAAVGEFPKYFTDEAAADAFAENYIRAFPREAAVPVNLSKSDQKTLAIEMARLQGSFWQRVHEEAAKLMPELKARYERELEENLEETRRYRMLNDGVKAVITEEDYKFLRHWLHPDKNPPPPGTSEEDAAKLKARWEKMFNIVLKLQGYVDDLKAKHARR